MWADMRLTTAIALFVLTPGVVLATPPADDSQRGAFINIWVRPSGDAERQHATVDLQSKPKLEVTREDLQYGGAKTKYRGVSLRALLETLDHTGRSDMVLLHYLNGMSVPLPIDDLELLKTLDPFVATELQVDGVWTNKFPPLTKKGAENRDARPLIFQGNKVVVASAAHPFTSKASRDDGFTPFFFGDTLTGIEFVRAENWYKQFDLGTSAPEKRGFELFKSHCQYCHSLREVGGRYGIDFLKPNPIVKRIGVQDLFLHVRYRDRNAPETGQMMPFFKDVSKDDVGAIYAWLQAVTAARPMPYIAPAHH